MYISLEAMKALSLHAESVYPDECCGLIIDGEYKAMTNIAHSPVRYEMSATELLAVADLGIEAVCHSHTASEAYPSQMDVDFAVNPDLVYIIISTSHDQLRAFRIIEGVITEEKV